MPKNIFLEIESKMNKNGKKMVKSKNGFTFNFPVSKFNFCSILKIFEFKVKKYIFENRIKNEQKWFYFNFPVSKFNFCLILKIKKNHYCFVSTKCY